MMKILYSRKFVGFSKQTFKYLGLTVVAVISGWILAFIFVIVIAFIIDGVNFTMSWYGNPWMILGLYSIPTIANTSLGYIVLNRFFSQVSILVLIKQEFYIVPRFVVSNSLNRSFCLFYFFMSIILI